MAFQFPWTNLHELNLDWFLSKFKQFTDNYLGTTATVELIPTTEQPEVTVTGGTLDDDTDIVDPFTFNFKLPINTSDGAVNSVNGMVGNVVLDKSDIGLGNVDNVQQYSATNPPPYPVTSVNGMTGDVIVQGANGNYAPAIITSASGVFAHFTDGADNIPVNDLTIGIDPVQSGSGTPAPGNIRPISGWTGANVSRDCKNLSNQFEVGTFTESRPAGSTYDSMKSNNNARLRSSALIPVLGQQITISWSNYTTYGVCFTYFDINGLYLGQSAGFQSWRWAVTTLNNPAIYYMACAVRRADNANMTDSDITALKLQVEVGASGTDYVPFNHSAMTISWQSAAGTVYGGSLDVTTGLLTVTDGYIASYNGETLPGEWISDRDVYAQGTTPTTGAQVVYELDTPQTYQLTPQQMNTLLGVNNIWCNTGDTTVEYTADTKEYIQNLTQPTEDDMVANTSIASGEFFMIGNNLYRASTAIASGSQIIPGTNATQLSLADALNLL